MRVEFRRERVLGEGGVVRWEVVALEAEGADPDLGGEIHDAERVENGTTCSATEWRVV